MAEKLVFSSAAATDTGQRRPRNEDCYGSDESIGCYVVADGVGGHANGEIASTTAVATLLANLAASENSDEPMSARIATALAYANQTIYEFNHEQGYAAGAGMGTALVGVVLKDDGRAWAFNIGDCRAYVWRGGQLSCVTQDHTLYRLWEEKGGVGPAPSKNILTRCIGPNPVVSADIQPLQFFAGDRLLLCSDGLTTMLEDSEIAWLLMESTTQPLPVACQRLISEANDRGGLDNITVMLLRVGAA